MNLDSIRKILKNRTSKPVEICRYYAVLLPLIEVDGALHILFEVRSGSIRTQPGEVSFPGGGVEPYEDFRAAALRETFEEIGVSPEQVELMGDLDYITNTGNFVLYPYAGHLNTELSALRLNPDEVEKVFTVPLSFFLEHPPEVHTLSYHPELSPDFPYDKIPNGKEYPWRPMSNPVPFYQWGEYIIWGMTAKIVRHFAEELLAAGGNGAASSDLSIT